MIEKIHIANFQSHNDTTLTLDPGLNVIVGSTDSGKSSIIRALRWLIWNRPMGDAFRSYWGGETMVQVEWPHYNVWRMKNEKGNYYHVNGSTLTAFGNDVPEEIQKALNMDETNLQRQGDSPFLISNSPGEVAAYFNKIASLDQIDTGLRKINGTIQKLSTRIATDQERVDSFSEELQRYEYLDKFEIDLEKLEKLEKERDIAQAAINNINNLAQSILDCDDMIDHIQERQDVLKPVDEILDLYREREALENSKTRIEISIFNIGEVESEINRISLGLADMEEYFHEQMKGTCPLCGSEIET